MRRIRIRDHQVVSDSPADFAGYDLGPSSPELLLGSLGSCLTHIFLIKAAELQLPLESLQVEIEGDLDPRGGKPGYEDVPFFPHNIRYTAHIVSPPTRRKCARCTRRWSSGVPSLTCSSVRSRWRAACGTRGRRRSRQGRDRGAEPGAIRAWARALA